ncbi:MAG: GIY-YIG nuclease family protein [Candidatus Cloacimonadaceae bacterium]|nr:GIY-YIG nuclease family protein [Candidatus Cloacimonadaceae bacterium]MDP3114813.1 GIY-YIG nuclease family protein [Candidatus Cloacimonadaceae bacterium]
MKHYYVYILASKTNGTLYTGVTGNLANKIELHKKGIQEGFTKRFGIHKLVWFQVFEDIRETLLAEKRIKKWNLEWKLNLIEKTNPNWDDLSNQVGWY